MTRVPDFLAWFGLMMALAFAPMGLTAQDGSSGSASSREGKAQDRARAAEESSSKDTRIDLSPPGDDQKNHPMSSIPSSDQNDASDVEEMHPWDPHKAAKNVEIGDFYFKKKNYKAAIERYKEALVYKPNDAIAHFRLAESLDKAGNSAEAATQYQEYLKILPHGPFAEDAQKALARLNDQSKPAASAK
ncbi:MAG: tetratricopeptide repeat protein [Acidobacteria bacterium]|nr:tetratricopeptide repeat protein [Acidobacteriota bacterium]